MKCNWIDKIRFWQRRQPTYTFADNFTTLVKGRKDVQLHGEVIGSILYTIVQAVWYAAAYVSAQVGLPVLSYSTIGTILKVGLYAGLSAASYMATSTQNQKQPTSLRGGTQVNGHAPGDTVRIPYGRVRTGGTWAYWKTTSTTVAYFNDYIHIVIGWGEGECSLDKDIEPGFFSGLGLNDLTTGGYYTGGTHNKYKAQIDNIGGTDTFKWYLDGVLQASTIPITGNWQILNNGVKIKYSKITGHTLNANWTFYAGDGIWVGDRLLQYFLETPPSSNPWIEHYFQGG